jgi:hypothetical protein
MKNTFKLLGIIALLAVIGFSMAACGGDDGGPSFDGTWVMQSNNNLGYTFKGKTFTQFDNDDGWSYSGTFTYTDTTITFLFPTLDDFQYSIYYTLTDTYLQLTLINPANNWWTGRFNKK